MFRQSTVIQTEQNKPSKNTYKITIEFILGQTSTAGQEASPSETTLGKTKFSVVNVYYLEIAPGSGMDTCVHFPSVLEPHLSWACAGPVHAAAVSMSSHTLH